MFADSKKASRQSKVIPQAKGKTIIRFFWFALVAVLGGQLFVYSFDPYSHWYLLPLAIGCLLYASYTSRALIACLNGFIFGASAFLPLFNWAQTYAGIEPWLALGLFEALFMSLFALIARSVLIRRGITLSSVIILALLWAAIEYLRAHYPWGGLPWALSAYSYAHSPLLNFGPWVGATGLAVITGFLGASCFLMLISLIQLRFSIRNGFHVIWAASMILLILLTALVIPRPAQISADSKPALEVVAIQGNVPRPPDGSYHQPKEMFDNHARETQRFISEEITNQETDKASPEIILWPEDSAGWDTTADEQRMQTLQSLSSQAQAPILIGTQSPTGTNNRYNKAVLIDQNGATGNEYIKRHPVPFGEYIPARSFFEKISSKTSLITSDMLPGNEIGVIPVVDTQIGVLICFEIAYDYTVSDVVNAGANIIVVQSNTALFGNSHEAIQQLAQAKVQAVISGRTVVHIATVGHSAIFTPDGRELTRLGHWEAGTMQAKVPLYQHLTPAIKYESEITTAILTLSLIALLLTWLKPVREIQENN